MRGHVAAKHMPCSGLEKGAARARRGGQVRLLPAGLHGRLRPPALAVEIRVKPEQAVAHSLAISLTIRALRTDHGEEVKGLRPAMFALPRHHPWASGMWPWKVAGHSQNLNTGVSFSSTTRCHATYNNSLQATAWHVLCCHVTPRRDDDLR